MTDATKPDLKPGTAARRTGMDPAWREELRGRVLAPANRRKAGPQGKANQGAPGVEGMTIEDCPAFAREPGASLRQTRRDAPDQPAPVRRTEIPKRHGQGNRGLGIPTVVDRRIQQALAPGLGPLFAPDFSAARFGFRPGRSAPPAGQQLQSSIKAGFQVAVDLDLAKCFARGTHEAVMARVTRQGRDKAVLRWMGQ